MAISRKSTRTRAKKKAPRDTHLPSLIDELIQWGARDGRWDDYGLLLLRKRISLRAIGVDLFASDDDIRTAFAVASWIESMLSDPAPGGSFILKQLAAVVQSDGGTERRSGVLAAHLFEALQVVVAFKKRWAGADEQRRDGMQNVIRRKLKKLDPRFGNLTAHDMHGAFGNRDRRRQAPLIAAELSVRCGAFGHKEIKKARKRFLEASSIANGTAQARPSRSPGTSSVKD